MAAKRRRNWDALLAESLTPCFMLDSRRRVLFFNRGCEELFGWNANEVEGSECRFLTEPNTALVESVTSALCPPEDVWQGASVSIPTFISPRSSTGSPESRLIKFEPLLDDEGLCHSVLGTISELKPASKTETGQLSHTIHTELAALRNSLRKKYDLSNIIANSPQMKCVLEQVNMAIGQSQVVCFIGEAGTGRQHFASTIHHAENPLSHAFIPLNCRMQPAFQLEEELQQLFAACGDKTLPTGLQPGTLFLNEADDLPRDLQSWLLEQYANPADQPLPRLMIGLTQSPQFHLSEENFLNDFYYLIAPLQIELPPLRNRPEDLPLLAQYFLEECNRLFEIDEQIDRFHTDVWKEIRKYHWPGNLDELQTTVREAFANCLSSEINVDDLPFAFNAGRQAQTLAAPVSQQEPLTEALQRIERELIEEALLQSRKNKTKAAKLLGLTRAKLYRRMENLGIPLEED